jgi:hypothetical protein
MADKVNHAQQAGQVQQAQKVDVARAVEQVKKLDSTALNKVNAQGFQAKVATQQVTQTAQSSKAGSMLGSMISHMEKGQGVMDKLIQAGMSGAKMNQGELIALQAGVYKYTQEMELTGKVVEKATSGLKDTLKTQV